MLAAGLVPAFGATPTAQLSQPLATVEGGGIKVRFSFLCVKITIVIASRPPQAVGLTRANKIGYELTLRSISAQSHFIPQTEAHLEQ